MARKALALPDDDDDNVDGEIVEEPIRPPATTPEAREAQLVGLAVDLAERQLKDGTASAQVISYLIKRGSTKDKLEEDLLEAKVAMEHAKMEALAAEARTEELYHQAIKAMRVYSGQDDGTEEIDDEDFDDDDDYY